MPHSETSRLPCGAPDASDDGLTLSNRPAGAADLWRVLYVSSATAGMGDNDWQALLPAWRQRNQDNDITGALLHDQGSLMQLLEGPARQVSRLFDAIRRDPRHGGLMVLMAESAAHRLLPGRALVAARRGIELVPMALGPAPDAAAKPATAHSVTDPALWAAIHSFGCVRPS